jgi:DNA-binding response OmpR family regulator
VRKAEMNATAADSEPLRQLLVLAEPALSEQLDDVAMPLGFHCVRAASASEVVALASEQQTAAIVVDLGAESASQLETLKALRENPRTAGVPLHVIGRSQEQEEALSLGGVNYLKRPVDTSMLRNALQTVNPDADGVRRVLVVEANPELARELEQLLLATGVQTTVVSTAAQAMQQLRERTVTCLVTDLDLPDAPGHELLRNLSEAGGLSVPNVVVYTGRDISEREEQEIMRYSDSIILKGPRSSERLLDEVTLFLHRVNQDSPPARSRRPASVARSGTQRLFGRKLLLVEDDVRSLFTLTSVLERQGAELSVARNGQAALQMLAEGSDAELILMDLMMPEMDGLEATRKIRQMPGRVAKLPIIALTAKDATDARDECVKAGANDYVSKPMDLDQLVALIRIWLSR